MQTGSGSTPAGATRSRSSRRNGDAEPHVPPTPSHSPTRAARGEHAPGQLMLPRPEAHPRDRACPVSWSSEARLECTLRTLTSVGINRASQEGNRSCRTATLPRRPTSLVRENLPDGQVGFLVASPTSAGPTRAVSPYLRPADERKTVLDPLAEFHPGERRWMCTLIRSPANEWKANAPSRNSVDPGDRRGRAPRWNR